MPFCEKPLPFWNDFWIFVYPLFVTEGDFLVDPGGLLFSLLLPSLLSFLNLTVVHLVKIITVGVGHRQEVGEGLGGDLPPLRVAVLIHLNQGFFLKI